jgi:hypothetical protein
VVEHRGFHFVACCEHQLAERQAARKRLACVGAFTRIALTTRQSHIITITMVRAIAVAVLTLVMVRLDSMRACAPAHRERVIIAVRFVSIA